MTTPRTIQYPMAYVKPYSPVHIDEAEQGDLHYCLGCDQQMITRKGEVRQHHFAHKPPFSDCDSDNALHETAKANISRGFLQAAESDEKYTLSFPCADCQTPIKTNIAEAGANIASERSVVLGTRSDLMVTKQDGTEPRVIIEIVVHHDLEPVTRQKYEDSQIPVIKIAPTVKGGEKVYHCGGGIVYHRHDEKGLNWEPGGIRSGAGVRSSGVSQESTGSSDTWEAALCRLCLRR